MADVVTVNSSPAASVQIPSLVAMLEAGVHFGHERSKQNPKMKGYVFTQRDRIGIIDLEKTQTALQNAAVFLAELARKPHHQILFVGTKRQASRLVAQYASKIQMPYVTTRWLGGTLTNFATILKSIEKLDELKAMERTKDVEKLTKKELSIRHKEIIRLETVLEGLRLLRTLPAAVVVVGAHDEKLAVKEANQVGLPVIGIVDTNANPQLLTYPIPANDDAVRSITLVLETLTAAISSARSAAPAEPAVTP